MPKQQLSYESEENCGGRGGAETEACTCKQFGLLSFHRQNDCGYSCCPHHCGVVNDGGCFIVFVVVIAVVATSFSLLLLSLSNIVGVLPLDNNNKD